MGELNMRLSYACIQCGFMKMAEQFTPLGACKVCGCQQWKVGGGEYRFVLDNRPELIRAMCLAGVLWSYERCQGITGYMHVLYDTSVRPFKRLGVVSCPESGVFNAFPKGGQQHVCESLEEAMMVVEWHYLNPQMQWEQASFLDLVQA
jgi:hypothetical protein